MQAFVQFITMQFQLCSVFFTFSLGTRTHYFGRALLHGGAKVILLQSDAHQFLNSEHWSSSFLKYYQYRATGRGFVVRHIKFAENYRLYSRSHFVKGFVITWSYFHDYLWKFSSTISFVLIVLGFCRMEVALLLIIFLAYGFNNGGAVGYILLSISSWIMALSWLFAPYLFNPSGFEWQK